MDALGSFSNVGNGVYGFAAAGTLDSVDVSMPAAKCLNEPETCTFNLDWDMDLEVFITVDKPQCLTVWDDPYAPEGWGGTSLYCCTGDINAEGAADQCYNQGEFCFCENAYDMIPSEPVPFYARGSIGIAHGPRGHQAPGISITYSTCADAHPVVFAGVRLEKGECAETTHTFVRYDEDKVGQVQAGVFGTSDIDNFWPQ